MLCNLSFWQTLLILSQLFLLLQKFKFHKNAIDALLTAGVFHCNASGARDIDNIYNPQAMKCLTGYALRPYFHDRAYTVAMRIVYQERNQLQFVINKSMDTALWFKLNFDVDKAPNVARIKELHALI